jgi:hypothetical protein
VNRAELEAEQPTALIRNQISAVKVLIIAHKKNTTLRL